MLTKDITYYTISCTVNEWNSVDEEYFDTLQEAWDKRYEYANWYCSKGNVTIRKYGTADGRIVALKEWQVMGDTWRVWNNESIGTGCPKE